MKHLFFSALMLGFALTSNAQLLNVQSIEKVNSPVSFDRAEISPDGMSVVASTNSSRALMHVNLADGKAEKLVDNGSIHQLKFSDDSKQIVYVHQSLNNKHMLYKDVRSLDLATKSEKQLVKATRHLNGVAMNGGNAMVINNQKMTVNNLRGEKAEKSAPVASVYYGQLMLTVDGKTKALNPQGKEGMSYLWPSVSPDGTKVLYYLGSTGCFVCDLNGENAQFLGSIRAPRWFGNDVVVGMRDADNGECVISSSLIAKDLNGVEQVLTPSDVIAMYPAVSANCDKISFTTPEGELYIMNVNR